MTQKILPCIRKTVHEFNISTEKRFCSNNVLSARKKDDPKLGYTRLQQCLTIAVLILYSHACKPRFHTQIIIYVTGLFIGVGA